MPENRIFLGLHFVIAKRKPFYIPRNVSHIRSSICQLPFSYVSTCLTCIPSRAQFGAIGSMPDSKWGMEGNTISKTVVLYRSSSQKTPGMRLELRTRNTDSLWGHGRYSWVICWQNHRRGLILANWEPGTSNTDNRYATSHLRSWP
jgi:hypothetical protein